MKKCFIGQTEITVDAVQLDLIINALGYYSSWKAENRFRVGVVKPEWEFLSEIRRIHALRERMKEIQDRCETPIF